MVSLVEIEYLPYSKIIVHELRKVEIADLLSNVVEQAEAQKAGGTPGITWVDGIAFVISEFLPTPEIIGESLKGRIHYAMVTFSETSYQPEKRVTLNNREHIVKLVKGDGNQNFVELAKFLKAFKSDSG